MPSSLSRRDVLRLLSFLSAGTAVVRGGPFISEFFANKANAQTSTVYVRENIATFMQSPEKIAALRTGVQVMQSRTDTDPTSWIYQANMHGIPRTEPRRLRAWNSCNHGSFFFFPWHRMYLYYFEQILRQASGDSSLVLPYWNYSDFPDQRSLPEPFRDQLLPDGSINPLYVEQRGAGINEGTTALSAAEVSYNAAFRLTNFFHTTDGGLSFGGLEVASPTHGGLGEGALESRPHDQVHLVVGGSNGWMRQVALSARDPIFWLHHANIDRLWERWLALGGVRANPINISDWRNYPFKFFNQEGTPVTLEGIDIVNTVQQLNYRYDDASLGNQVQLRPGNVGDDDRSSQRTTASPRLLATTPVNDQQPLIELREAPVNLTLRFINAQAARLFADVDLEESFLILNVEGVTYNPRNSIPYEIYIDLPEGVTPDRNSPYHVGRLALFAHNQNSTFRIDISEVVSKLRRLNLITGGSISVTFVPPAEELAALQGTDPSRQLPNTVRFKRVTITLFD